MTQEGMEWLDDPSTVDPKDWLLRIAAADPKPGDAMKRARSRLHYFLTTQKHALAPSPPFPSGHVFTENFFRWLVQKYPRIEGIHPHYRRIPISNSFSVRWGNAKPPGSPPDPLAVLRKENEQLKAQIAVLEEDIRKFREKEECRKAINRENARRPRNPQ